MDCTSDKTEFRLWSTIRIKSSKSTSLALIGICSYGNKDKLLNARICYGKIYPTIDDLVTNVIKYSKNIFIPWFNKYHNQESLLNKLSPIEYIDKVLLINNDILTSQETKNVLGIK